MSIPLSTSSTSEPGFYVGAVERLRSVIGDARATLEERLDAAIDSTSARISHNEQLIQAELFVIGDGLKY